MAKILVVEDDPLLAKLYSSALISGEFEVDLARNGEIGLTKILQGGYGLILLDVMLPEMDGLAILNTLQSKTPQIPNGPIVVMTNLSSEAIAKKALSLGAIELINKTDLKADDLPKMVQTWLKY